jgi:hypothetical protein
VLDDRAAEFLPQDNLLQANAGCPVFTDMYDYWCDEYSVPHGNQAIVEVVHEWFEQGLVETVIGCQALQRERRWSPNDVDNVLSEEALTTAVMQRYRMPMPSSAPSEPRRHRHASGVRDKRGT